MSRGAACGVTPDRPSNNMTPANGEAMDDRIVPAAPVEPSEQRLERARAAAEPRYAETSDRERLLDEIRRRKRIDHYRARLRHRDGRLVHVITSVVGQFNEA